MDELLVKSENSMEENNDETWLPKRSKRTIKDWTEEDVMKLISFVETREILWNPSYPNYHNKPLRCNVWQEISECLESKFTVEEIIAKWTNLRIQFRGYVARNKTNKWRYFHVLQFLKKVEVNKRPNRMSRSVHMKVEDRAESAMNGEIIGYSTPNTSRSSRSQSPVTVPSSSVAVEMQEPSNPVRIYKCKNEHISDRNLAFTRYLCSELHAMPEDDASFVRNTLNRQLLDCLQQINIRKQQEQHQQQHQQQEQHQQQHQQQVIHQHQQPQTTQQQQQHHSQPPPQPVQTQQYVPQPSFTEMLGPSHLQ